MSRGTDAPIQREQLSRLFPFHVIFSHRLEIISLGRSMTRIWPQITSGSADRLSLVRPEKPLRYSTLHGLANKPVTLAFEGAEIKLAGHVIVLSNSDLMIAGTIDTADIDRFFDIGLSESDFAPADPMPKLAFLARGQNKLVETMRCDLERNKLRLRLLAAEFLTLRVLSEAPLIEAGHELCTHLREALGALEVSIWNDGDTKRAPLFVAGGVPRSKAKSAWTKTTVIESNGMNLKVVMPDDSHREALSDCLTHIAETMERFVRAEVARIARQERTASHVQTLSREARLARDAHARRAQFISAISQEMSSPLCAIGEALGLLQQSKLSSKQLEYLSIAQSANGRLSRLVNDNLDIVRLDAGELRPRPDTFNLSSLLQQVVASHAYEARTKNVDLTLEVDDDVPEQLIGDKARIAQILTNLISTALETTKFGAIAVLVTGEGELEGGDYSLMLEVSDTGTGIDDDSLKKAAKAYRGEEAQHLSSRELSLVIVKRIAKMLDGRVGLESTHKVGTVVTVELPTKVPKTKRRRRVSTQWSERAPLRGLAVAYLGDDPKLLAPTATAMRRLGAKRFKTNPQQLREFDVILCELDQAFRAPPNKTLTVGATTSNAELRHPFEDAIIVQQFATITSRHASETVVGSTFDARPLQNVSILIVDNSPINATISQAYLNSLGAQITVALDPDVAISHTDKSDFDFIFVDVESPVIPGAVFCGALHKRAPTATLLALIDPSNTDLRQACLTAGVSAFVAKPSTPEALVDAIEAQFDMDAVDSELPIIDTSKLHQLFELAREEGSRLVEEFAAVFFEDGERHMRALRKALDDGNEEIITQVCLRFRGAGAQVGAVALGHALDTLASAGESKRKKQLSEVERLLECTHKTLRSFSSH